ncbi:MAG: DUF1501 domain-containing protein [Pirellulaceae bacterium]
MLSFFDRHRRIGRRDFLTVGSLGLGGLSLPGLLRAADADQGIVRDKAVIFVFLHGGPSQYETFDPKMSAPVEVRSTTGEIATSVPGLTFGGTFPRLASLADRLSIVRSFRSGDGNHDIKPIVARSTANANLGSLYARLAGVNHPRTNLPRNVAIFPRAVDDRAQGPVTSFGNFASTGHLGGAYAPFIPGGSGEAQQNMILQLERDRFDDRRGLLSGLDRLQREVDALGSINGLDRFQEQAFTTILGGVAEAFDLGQEERATVEAYDTESRINVSEISRRWNNYDNYVDNARSLGKLLLLARRLCERGCGFAMVTTNFVWDMHSDVNNAGVEEGMQYMGWPLDHALGTLIEDLEQRGLSDKIQVVVTGEMGRTPRINGNGGRDHWGGLTPLLVYGGGTPGGQVIGHSSVDGGSPASEPIELPHLVASVMHQLLDVSKLRTLTGVPDEVLRAVTAAAPIPELVG